MYIFIWNPYCHTSIQAQPDGDCLMKILDGNIIEQKFANCDAFSIINQLKPGDISFNSEDHGLQRIHNNKLQYAYSLNLYTPNIYLDKIKKMKTESNLLPPSKITHCGFSNF